ncbi:MAG: STAS domain-containing protein [Victivallaceae bacterium]|nr:STAS domain-containing protein [Victivallaceae bacterium]
MEIVLQNRNGYRYLGIDGRLDATTSQDADAELRGKLDDCKALVIDLAKLSYISSAGLRVLLIVAKQMQQRGGKVVICNLSETVQEVFDISGFSAIFNVCADIPAAEAAVC